MMDHCCICCFLVSCHRGTRVVMCVCNAVHSTDGCGIICIIGPIPRYSDFQVHERRPDGNVTKLTSCIGGKEGGGGGQV